MYISVIMSADPTIMDAPPPYSPRDPLTPASSTSSEASMTILPIRPSLRGGYLRAAEEPEETSLSAAVVYFQERPFTRPLPNPLIVHYPHITPFTTREDLPPPVSFNEWLARDVNFQDWATFTNFLISELDVHPDDKDAENRKPLAPEEVQARHGKIEDVVAEWNEGFFGPRGIKISPHYNMDPTARFPNLASHASPFPTVHSTGHSDNLHHPLMRSHVYGGMSPHHSGPPHHESYPWPGRGHVGPIPGVSPHHSGSHHHVSYPWPGREHLGPIPGVNHPVPAPNIRVSGQSGFMSGVGRFPIPTQSHKRPVCVPHYHDDEVHDGHHRRDGERRGRRHGRGDRPNGRAPGKHRRRNSSTSSSSSSSSGFHGKHHRRDSSTSSSSSSSSGSSISSLSSDELEGANVNDIRQSLAAFRLDPTNKKHIRTAVRQLHSELRAHKRESRGESKERSREAKAEFRSQKRAIRSEVKALTKEARTMKRAEKREKKAEKKAMKAEQKARKRASKHYRRGGSIEKEGSRQYVGPMGSPYSRDPQESFGVRIDSGNIVGQSSGVLSARDVEMESQSKGENAEMINWQSELGGEKKSKAEEESRDNIQRDIQGRNPEKLELEERLEKLAETRKMEAREREAEAREARLEREREASDNVLRMQAEARDNHFEHASRYRNQQAEIRTQQLEQAADQREQQAELRSKQLEQASKQREREAETRAKKVRFSSGPRQSSEDGRVRELEQVARRMEQEAEKTRREAERLRREATQRRSGASPLNDASVFTGPPSMPGAFLGGGGGSPWANGSNQAQGPATQGESSSGGVGAWGEEFGRNMEQWGRNFGRSMEGWGQGFGRDMEEKGRRLERSLR